MAKPLRKSQKRRPAQQQRTRSVQADLTAQAEQEQNQIYPEFEPLHFALPRNRSEVSPLEQELFHLLEQGDAPDGAFELSSFFAQEHQRFLQADQAKVKAITQALALLSIYDKKAFDTVEPLKMALTLRPLEEVVRFANGVMRLYDSDDSPMGAAKRRVTLFGLVLENLVKNCLVILERYSISSGNDDFRNYCGWLQMIADQALERMQLRCIFAFDSMISEEDEALWQSLRFEGRPVMGDLLFVAASCMLYIKLVQAKERLLQAAPDRAAAEAQLWFKPIPLSSIPETDLELKAREYLDLD